MKAIVMELLVLGFLSSTVVAANAGEGDSGGDERSPAVAKNQMSDMIKSADIIDATRDESRIATSEAQIINGGRQLKTSAAAPRNEKKPGDAQLLSD